MSIAVLVPTYNRPSMLRITLKSWLEADSLKSFFVVAEASSQDVLREYSHVFEDYAKYDKIFYKLSLTKLGSINARNILLNLALEHNHEFIVMADDDYLLPNTECLVNMAKKLESEPNIGAVAGRVVVFGKRKDGDFFLNFQINIADFMSKLTGYVFLDVKNGPRYSEFVPPFFMIKREVLEKIQYDQIFDTPTCFREESDLQAQIKKLNYNLLFDPDFHVIHLAAEEGGNRPKISFGKRIYWKARNSVVFIWKWNNLAVKRFWCAMFCVLILFLYSPWNLLFILRGVSDGIRLLHNNKLYRVIK